MKAQHQADHESNVVSHLSHDVHAEIGGSHHPKSVWEKLGRRAVITALLAVVITPPLAGFYSFITGVPLKLLASRSEAESSSTTRVRNDRITLVVDEPHAIVVPEKVCESLEILRHGQFAVSAVQPPKSMQPLALRGSTAFDPSRLARIRARFAPARVVEIGQYMDHPPLEGQTVFRELRPGDRVFSGELLGVFYSADVGAKKSDLLDSLVQLNLDQKILDRVEANRASVPEVFYLTQLRSVQGDRNAINRALNNLRLWDIPNEEINALHAEAAKISADKDAWFKTPEGRWVRGANDNQKRNEIIVRDSGASANESTLTQETESAANVIHENPWGRVTLRAPFDGVIVERNVHKDEMVIDNTVNLFEIADVSKLLVIVSCPEDQLPVISSSRKLWSIRTVGVDSAEGLLGSIDEISYIIDPSQHTAVIKGYVNNPHGQLRAGQFVSATVILDPPDDVVEVSTDALVDDGKQAMLFVQPDANIAKFELRRVEVTHRFEQTAFIRSAPFGDDEQPNLADKQDARFLKKPVLPGERVLLNGVLELKTALMDLEEAEAAKPQNSVGQSKWETSK